MTEIFAEVQDAQQEINGGMQTFEGPPGKSPRIGDNGNWFVFDDVTRLWVDTGVCAKAEGDPGKSAYQYAVEGGYKGTEAEFAEKMAAEYVKNTDYATGIRAGIIQPGGGLSVQDNGILEVTRANKFPIYNREPSAAIFPDMLDYAIKVGITTNTETLTAEEQTAARAWLDAVGSTDYANAAKGGVVKVDGTYGIGKNVLDKLYIIPASNAEIENKYTGFKPIVPQNLEVAVKVGVTTNTIVLTNEEKQTAQTWLGIDTLIGDINTALDEIIAIQNSLIGGDSA